MLTWQGMLWRIDQKCTFGALPQTLTKVRTALGRYGFGGAGFRGVAASGKLVNPNLNFVPNCREAISYDGLLVPPLPGLCG